MLVECCRLVVLVAVSGSCPHAVTGGEQQAGEAESTASSAATEPVFLGVDSAQIEIIVFVSVPSFDVAP